MQKLYAIERYLVENEITGLDKIEYRKQNAIPLLKELGLWMQQVYPQVLPGSAIGKAIFYTLSRWEKLSLYATTDILGIVSS